MCGSLKLFLFAMGPPFVLLRSSADRRLFYNGYVVLGTGRGVGAPKEISSRTISGTLPVRTGGPQVPTPHET